MRMMMKAAIGLEAGNRAVKDGRIGKIMGTTIEKLKPEAAYFTSLHGRRTAFFVFDMTDSAQLPVLVESLFQELEAEVEIVPVMNGEDLKKGLAALPAK